MASVAQELEQWFFDLIGYVPKTAGAVTTTNVNAGATLGLGITTDVGEGFKAISAVSTLVTALGARNNTPAEIQAANAQKLQDLKDHAASVLSAAQAAGPGTSEWHALEVLLS